MARVVLLFVGMTPPKLILLALVGASLAACERAAPPSAQTEPQAVPSAASPSPNTKVARAVDPPSTKPQTRPAPETISDAFITGAVRAALMGDPGLRGADVSVNTSHGVVSLTGTVRSPEQVAEATARAQAPDGVVRLDTHVSVVPP